jgi:hypothetical protein
VVTSNQVFPISRPDFSVRILSPDFASFADGSAISLVIAFWGKLRPPAADYQPPPIAAKLLKIKEFRGDFATHHCITRGQGRNSEKPGGNVEKEAL